MRVTVILQLCKYVILRFCEGLCGLRNLYIMHRRRVDEKVTDPELRLESGRRCLVDFANDLIQKYVKPVVDIIKKYYVLPTEINRLQNMISEDENLAEAASKTKCINNQKRNQREQTIEKLSDMIKWISSL